MSVLFQSYRFLERAFEQLSRIEDIIDFMKWNCVNYANSFSYPLDDINLMEEIKYDMLSNPTLSSAIEDAEAKRHLLTPEQASNLKCMTSFSRYFSCIPADLYKSFIRARTKGFFSWVALNNRYCEFNEVVSSFASLLDRLRDVAVCISEAEGVGRYDALMGLVEREVRSIDIELVLSKLGPVIRKSLPDTIFAGGGGTKTVNICKQKKVIEECSAKLGFSKDELFIGEGKYETCNLIRPGDYRIFVDYSDACTHNSVSSLLKASGYAIYNAALSPTWAGQPVCRNNLSLMQIVTSMLSEQISTCSEFEFFIKPYVKGLSFGFGKVQKGNLMKLFSSREEDSNHKLINSSIFKITCSSIRYSLERELLEGKLENDCIIDAWTEGLSYYFGSEVKLNHKDCYGEYWAGGRFCELPLGIFSSVISAQLFARLREQNQNLMSEIKEGEFLSVFRWIRDNILLHSVTKSSTEILSDICGSSIDVDIYAKSCGLIRK